MPRIDDLLERIQQLDEEVQAEFEKKRDDFQFVIEKKRIRFSQDVMELQRKSKRGLLRYVFGASPLNWLATPVIWSGVVPMLLLDVFLTVFQAVCFRAYQIPRVKRSEYLVFDRGDLPYLNAIEKVNCFYCGYANGLASYFREIAARTEQYWCPIKHARRIVSAHEYYPQFFEFGDAESYRLGLERLRKALSELDEDAPA
ncbi:MAG: hypothetical protein LLG08_02385 [Actinomycetia bacterium]|nr:hypothetical protein [Actinomycetes bacterium]